MTEPIKNSRSVRSVLMLGCGDLGTRAGLQLCRQSYRIDAVRRNVKKLPAAFIVHSADYSEPGSLNMLQGLAPDVVIATFNPLDRSETGYRRGFTGGMENLLQGLGQHRPQHIIMSSSTRVYAERDGGWVDEASALTNDDPWAASIIAAEELLLNSGHGASVVRFGGIYGVPGGRLLSRINRGEICPREPVRYTNRIHRQDCAGFLVHLVEMVARGEVPEPIYTAVDDNPAPRYEVESWLAAQLEVPLSANDEHEPTRHNAGGHKRCSNRALRDSGYELIYPDYVSGYTALLSEAR